MEPPANIEVINKLKLPLNIKELQRFLSLVNYHEFRTQTEKTFFVHEIYIVEIHFKILKMF